VEVAQLVITLRPPSACFIFCSYRLLNIVTTISFHFRDYRSYHIVRTVRRRLRGWTARVVVVVVGHFVKAIREVTDSSEVTELTTLSVSLSSLSLSFCRSPSLLVELSRRRDDDGLWGNLSLRRRRLLRAQIASSHRPTDVCFRQSRYVTDRQTDGQTDGRTDMLLLLLPMA